MRMKPNDLSPLKPRNTPVNVSVDRSSVLDIAQIWRKSVPTIHDRLRLKHPCKNDTMHKRHHPRHDIKRITHHVRRDAANNCLPRRYAANSFVLTRLDAANNCISRREAANAVDANMCHFFQNSNEIVIQLPHWKIADYIYIFIYIYIYTDTLKRVQAANMTKQRGKHSQQAGSRRHIQHDSLQNGVLYTVISFPIVRFCIAIFFCQYYVWCRFSLVFF